MEVVFPIEQADLKQRVIDILKLTLADNAKARELLPDGTYRRVKPPEGVPTLRSQVRFLELAAEAGTRANAAPAPEVPVAPRPRVARTRREKGRKGP